MSTTFESYDPERPDLLRELSVNMHGGNAARVMAALGLQGDALWGGSLPAQQFLTMVLRHADGHPDPYIAGRLLELAELAREAAKHGLNVTWG